ncbi:hypothetical protein ASPWEDRAFT_40965 [Aspergillus wentii DTO 134E9]|uniref:Uracil-DNA glycosylase n=1 Tax=Aspergillus wentii DTO 134E9 TaxID=1073089 RepID=A0A1L9RLB1_ASPWE|nr:uncharacterized protein ASPWEDRAFT_40965 [Aspergillus wentii DTO 134E9]KAI9924509.1 uracil DNA glycosylase [Aspergillus wentii]OJJ35726.1 hypothetical protein ASPWEDRAFT_40965 [Aspergillus wentii DTO 134E9]
MVSPTGVKRNANHLATPDGGNKKPKGKGSITSFFGPPQKTKCADLKPQTSSPNFDKKKWVASLTSEQKELLQLEIDTLEESWLAQLKEEVVSPEFLALKRFLQKEKQSGAKIFPPEKDIYSWSRFTPLHSVKVVIVGQDPYHNVNQAHGLAFSVLPPTPAPQSLANIYTCLKNDYPSFERPPNKGGLLTPWAERGVLMLNTCLTVRAHSANSHSNKGWEKFTQKALDTVARVRSRGVVFLAWGTPAGKRVGAINRDRHYVLQSVHPSPLSAHRGFLNNGHFKKCNEWLAERYGEDGIIDWNLTPKTNANAPSAALQNTTPEKKSSKSQPPEEKDKEPPHADSDDDEFEDDDIDAVEALAAAESADQANPKSG